MKEKFTEAGDNMTGRSLVQDHHLLPLINCIFFYSIRKQSSTSHSALYCCLMCPKHKTLSHFSILCFQRAALRHEACLPLGQREGLLIACCKRTRFPNFSVLL